ncbi:MAG: flagellar basal body rod protein FlgB [Oligoflexia bacterium]|nr:flagellar basal body rod protein FlgB [Oligoflexia bacterium]
MDVTQDRAINALAISLNFRQMRQNLSAANIANSETPNYHARRLDFEEALKRALDNEGEQTMRVENKRHYNVGEGGVSELQPEIYEDQNGVISEDGNSVVQDTEMALMAQNKILYDASVQLLNKKLGLMKYAIGAER